MPNKFITPEEMAKSLLEAINDKSDDYKKKTGCTDDEREKFRLNLVHAMNYAMNIIIG